MSNLKLYLASSFLLELDSEKVGTKLLNQPPSQIEGLFYQGYHYIYELTEATTEIYKVILKNLNHTFTSDKDMQYEFINCQIIAVSTRYTITKREFINLYEFNKASLKLEPDKHIVMGYFLPVDHKFINQEIESYGQRFKLLSISYYQNSLKLHLFNIRSNNSSKSYNFISQIDIDKLISESRSQRDYINTIEIEGNESKNYLGFKQLFLAEYYKSLGYLNETDNIEVMTKIFEYNFDNPFPLNKITLKFGNNFESYPLEIPIKVKLETPVKDNKVYYNGKNGDLQFFYIDNLILFDTNKHLDSKLEELKQNDKFDLTDEQINEFKANMAMDCPSDKRLLVLIWENPTDTNIEFRLKDNPKLQELLNNMDTQASCISVAFYGCDQIGINGYKERWNHLNQSQIFVPANLLDYIDELEIEAHSFNKMLPPMEPITLSF